MVAVECCWTGCDWSPLIVEIDSKTRFEGGHIVRAGSGCWRLKVRELNPPIVTVVGPVEGDGAMGEVNAIGGVSQCRGRYEEKYEKVHGVKYGQRGLKKENIVKVCELLLVLSQ